MSKFPSLYPSSVWCSSPSWSANRGKEDHRGSGAICLCEGNPIWTNIWCHQQNHKGCSPGLQWTGSGPSHRYELHREESRHAAPPLSQGTRWHLWINNHLVVSHHWSKMSWLVSFEYTIISSSCVHLSFNFFLSLTEYFHLFILQANDPTLSSGRSFFADGFRIAKWLEENEPAAFLVLTSIPIRWGRAVRYKVWIYI